MIGLDTSDKRVFDQCVHHKSPEGDLHGDQIFTLAGMELTLDCVKMRSTRPIQFIGPFQASWNASLSTIGIGWHVKTHLKWFDKIIDITKLKAKSPPFFNCKMKNLYEAQESVWMNKTLAIVCLDHENDNGRVYSMICNVKQALLKDPSVSAGRYKVFLTIQNSYADIK